MNHPFLDRLRSETAAAHRALEQNRYAAALMGEAVNTADYTAYLEKMYGFVPVFEAVILPVLQNIISHTGEMKKTHLLQADLLQLNRKLVDVPRIDAARFAPLAATEGKALGSLYVMEGSVLGGMVICKHVQNHLGHSIDNSTHFFTAYGASTGTRWKNFLVQLCEQAEGREAEVIEGAVHTFRLMDEWMCETPVAAIP